MDETATSGLWKGVHANEKPMFLENSTRPTFVSTKMFAFQVTLYVSRFTSDTSQSADQVSAGSLQE